MDLQGHVDVQQSDGVLGRYSFQILFPYRLFSIVFPILNIKIFSIVPCAIQ